MTPIITITPEIIGTEETNTVNARELHQSLEVKKKYSDWVKAQISSLGFEENVDYITISLKREIANSGYKTVKEYILTLDAAKHIAMASRSARGKAIRAYFIEVEKQWRRQAQTSAVPAVIEMVVANLKQLGDVVAVLSDQMERLDRRLLVHEQAEAHRREQARRRQAQRKARPASLVAQAYEGRRAAFLTQVHGVLLSAGVPLNQTELLRRSGYKRDDKTARKWLGEGIGVYWRVRAEGRSVLYRLIDGAEARAEAEGAKVSAGASAALTSGLMGKGAAS